MHTRVLFYVNIYGQKMKYFRQRMHRVVVALTAMEALSLEVSSLSDET